MVQIKYTVMEIYWFRINIKRYGFVLFVLSGCYVVMLCVKIKKNVDHKKKKNVMEIY